MGKLGVMMGGICSPRAYRVQDSGPRDQSALHQAPDMALETLDAKAVPSHYNARQPRQATRQACLTPSQQSTLWLGHRK